MHLVCIGYSVERVYNLELFLRWCWYKTHGSSWHLFNSFFCEHKQVFVKEQWHLDTMTPYTSRCTEVVPRHDGAPIYTQVRRDGTRKQLCSHTHYGAQRWHQDMMVLIYTPKCTEMTPGNNYVPIYIQVHRGGTKTWWCSNTHPGAQRWHGEIIMNLHTYRCTEMAPGRY